MPRSADMRAVKRRPDRPQSWVVAQAASLSPTGKKRERWFVSKEKADTWIKSEKTRLRSFSDKSAGLTDEEKMEAAQAFVLCRTHGFSLLEAAREKAISIAAEKDSIMVSAMVSKAVAQMRKERKSARHIGQAVHIANRMVGHFIGLTCGQLTTAKAQEWLDGLADTLAPETLKQYRRYGHLFCEHGRIRGGYFKTNPFKDVQLNYNKEGEHDAISILTPAQVRKLLECADDKLKPYLALCAFAGLRPSEAQGLNWEDVFSQSIYVRAKSAKTRRHRHVDTSENLAEWVEPLPTAGKVYWSRRLFRRAVEAAGLTPWQPDVLRHAYGSYWLALHKDENRLAQEMGNSPNIIVQNYRVPVSEADAKEYFSIVP